MKYEYLAYIGKPAKVESAIGQANFVKEISSAVPICPGDVIQLDKLYYVEVVLHSKAKPTLLLLEAAIAYQFNPSPWLVDTTKGNAPSQENNLNIIK